MRATSSRGEELTIDRDNDKNPVVALREIADETIDLGRIEQDLIKSLSRAPEPEPADEEVLDLIPTDQNIFGLQDVTAEEEAASLPAEGEEMSPEDLEAAIEAELGGRRRTVAANERGGRRQRGHEAGLAPVFAPDGRRPTAAPRASGRRCSGSAALDRKAPRLRPEGRHRADRRRLCAGRCRRTARSGATTAIPTSPTRSRWPTSWPATGSTPPRSPPALLHDVIEDTPVKLPEIETRFGDEIAGLVDGVTKLTRLELQSDRTKQAENFRKLVLAISRDIRVLLVKLADRLHNMRTLHFVQDAERRQRIARETMEIYAPLAERIGMDAVKTELQTLAFAQLDPEAYATIQARLNFLRGQGADVIEEVRERARRVCEESGRRR